MVTLSSRIFSQALLIGCLMMCLPAGYLRLERRRKNAKMPSEAIRAVRFWALSSEGIEHTAQ